MTLDSAALDTLFREARTHSKWTDAPVSDETLRELYDLLKLGPTSGNGSPGRFVFVRTRAGKDKLAPALSEGNRAKTMAAPVTVIVAYDPRFYDLLPRLYPQADARSWFADNEALAEATAGARPAAGAPLAPRRVRARAGERRRQVPQQQLGWRAARNESVSYTLRSTSESWISKL